MDDRGPGVYLIAPCLLSLRPLFRKIFDNPKLASLHLVMAFYPTKLYSRSGSNGTSFGNHDAKAMSLSNSPVKFGFPHYTDPVGFSYPTTADEDLVTCRQTVS